MLTIRYYQILSLIHSLDKNNNVIIINESHHKIDEFVNEEINCICYNLGYLPGGNKQITTLAETSLKSCLLYTSRCV